MMYERLLVCSDLKAIRGNSDYPGAQAVAGEGEN